MKYLFRVFLSVLVICTALTVKAQTDDWGQSTLLNDDYSRGKTVGTGFFLRPEYHGGWSLTFGAQPWSYGQLYVGVGQLMTKDLAWTMGMRFWFFDSEFSVWADNRYSFAFDFENLAASISIGVSYKDFDIGVGLEYGSDPTSPDYGYNGYFYGYELTLHPVLSIGYNIRCYEHR